MDPATLSATLAEVFLSDGTPPGQKPANSSNEASTPQPKENLGQYQSGVEWFLIRRNEDPANVHGQKCRAVPDYFKATVCGWGGILEEDWLARKKNASALKKSILAQDQREEDDTPPPAKSRRLDRAASPTLSPPRPSKKGGVKKSVVEEVARYNGKEIRESEAHKEKRRKGMRPFQHFRDGFDEEVGIDGVLLSDDDDEYGLGGH